MCRVLGSVSAEPVSIRHELLESENPLIRQSEHHDSGWGMAVYERTDGDAPRCVRFPEAAYSNGEFEEATDLRGRIFNVHVRRATMGGLTLENTHPFCMGNYSFCHNGTILRYTRLIEDGVRPVHGQTDSVHFFNFLMRDFDPGDATGSVRRAVAAVAQRSEFSGVNFLLSDGERLFAYRLGIFELHWATRPGQLLVASERMTAETWHAVRQDVLLTLDPEDIEEPRAERILGDDAVERAQIVKFEEGTGLRGAARGEFAAQRAARLSSAAAE